MATGNISRKTYENRTQVDIPFSSVPIVSPTVTAGRGAVVGPAQVQPSKLVSLSNALGIATQATSTLTNIAELQKQQGLRAGKLAAEAEQNAQDAFNKMEVAGQKAVEAGTLSKSQLPSFQFSYKSVMADKMALDYRNKLIARIPDSVKNLDSSQNNTEFLQGIVDEVRGEFVENIQDPLTLSNFNKASAGYTSEFYNQGIRARDKALQANLVSTAIANNSVALQTLSEEKDIIKLGNGAQKLYTTPTTAGESPLETALNAWDSTSSAINNLLSGDINDPTFPQRLEQAEDLLLVVDSVKLKNGVKATSLDEISDKYFRATATLNSYKERVKANIQKAEDDFSDLNNAFNSLLLNVINTDNPKAISDFEEITKKISGTSFTEERFQNVIKVARAGNKNLIQSAVLELIPANLKNKFYGSMGELDRVIDEAQSSVPMSDTQFEEAIKLVKNAGDNGEKFPLLIPQLYGVPTKDQTQTLWDTWGIGSENSYGTSRDKVNTVVSDMTRNAIKETNRIGQDAGLGTLVQFLQEEGDARTATEIKTELSVNTNLQTALVNASNDFEERYDNAVAIAVAQYRNRNNGKDPTSNEFKILINGVNERLQEPYYKEIQDIGNEFKNSFKFTKFTQEAQNTEDYIQEVTSSLERLPEESLKFSGTNKQTATLNDEKGQPLKKNITQLTASTIFTGIDVGYMKGNRADVFETLGLPSPSYATLQEWENINPFETLIVDYQIVEGTRWDYKNRGNKDNLWNKIETQLKASEDNGIDLDKIEYGKGYDDAKAWAERTNIKTVASQLLFIQRQAQLETNRKAREKKMTPNEWQRNLEFDYRTTDNEKIKAAREKSKNELAASSKRLINDSDTWWIPLAKEQEEEAKKPKKKEIKIPSDTKIKSAYQLIGTSKNKDD